MALPITGEATLSSEMKMYLWRMTRDLLFQQKEKSLSRKVQESTEFNFICYRTDAEA